MNNYKVKVIVLSIVSIFSVVIVSGVIFIALFGTSVKLPFTLTLPTLGSTPEPTVEATTDPSSTPIPSISTTVSVTQPMDSALICVENAKATLLANGKDQTYIDALSDDQAVAEAYGNPIITQRWSLYNPPASALPYPSVDVINTTLSSMKSALYQGNMNGIISEYNNFSSQYNVNALQCEPLVSLYNDATLYKNASFYLQEGNEDLFVMEVQEKFQSMDMLIYAALNGHEGLIYHRNDDLLPFEQSITTETPMYIQLSDPSAQSYSTLDPFASMYVTVQFHTSDGTSYTAVGGMHEGYTKLLTIGKTLA